jgi:bidirectional [NiFe] hydrogenase diaphorase subunit
VSGRGLDSRVITDMSIPWGDSITCTSCGKCVNVCPTGALFRRGVTVGEMTKDRAKLEFLGHARSERIWNVEDIVPKDGQ